MTDYAIIPSADYKAACDAIRAKTGKTDLIKSGDMAGEIESISGGGGAYEGNPYLTFSSADAFSIATYGSKKHWLGTLYYSTDTATWNEWDGTTVIESAEHEGEQRLYIRGVNNAYICGGNTGTGWTFTGNSVRCDGNIETLLDYNVVLAGYHPAMGTYCFSELFKGWTTLIKAPELPATILSNSCYYYMFRGCSSLATAPELPATTLASSCYVSMFTNCTALKKPPELPATTLAYGCCQYMFSGSGLETPPELPVTKLESRCYSYMFQSCASLTKVPKLPATTLVQSCYESMFYGCTALTTLPELPATTLESSCYNAMFRKCTGIKLSETQTGEYQTPYRLPTSGTGTVASTYSLANMFTETGGTFTGAPTINTTYYTSNTVV